MNKALRWVDAADAPVLQERSIDGYRVQVFCHLGEVVYRVLGEIARNVWKKILCFTAEDERSYPKRAARLGARMVNEINAGQRTMWPEPQPRALWPQ